MQPDDIDALAWSRSTDARAGGLLPAIVQDAGNQRVLMLGWWAGEAWQVTLDTGWVTFHGRSRGRLWTKGGTSGHGLALVSIEADCDGDTLLLQARPQGPTCHLGRASCFAGAPEPALAQLDAIIAQRERDRPTGSYTTRLFEQGRSEEHTSELQSLMRTSYAVFCLKTKKNKNTPPDKTLTQQQLRKIDNSIL